MPYIIETRTFSDIGVQTIWDYTRTAVATVDEAREAVAIALVEHVGDNSRIQRMVDTLGNSGGTVGPLPDGTVIKVKSA